MLCGMVIRVHLKLRATVDYLFAFAATTKCVRNHHFDQLHSAYIEDKEVRMFIQENNSDAFNEIIARFAEAIDRGIVGTTTKTQPIMN